MKTATYHQVEGEPAKSFKVANETEEDGVKFADLTDDNGSVVIGHCEISDTAEVGKCTIDGAKAAAPVKDK